MFQVATISEEGFRSYREDTYFLDFDKKHGEIFARVYNACSGSFAAEYARNNLDKIFLGK